MFALALVVTGSYLLGSIPFGYLAGRIAGIDVRRFGSGNIGATNVTRTLGKAYGYPVFAADFGKGLIAVLIADCVSRQPGGSGAQEIFEVVAAVACVLGN